MSDHLAIQALLSGYLDGELSADERGRVEVHLADCEACREELALLRVTLDALHGLEAPRAPSGFADAVLARVAAGDGQAARSGAGVGGPAKVVPLRPRRRGWVWGSAAVAAAAGLMVAAVWWLGPGLGGDAGGPADQAVASRAEEAMAPARSKASARPEQEYADADALADGGPVATPSSDLPSADPAGGEQRPAAGVPAEVAPDALDALADTGLAGVIGGDGDGGGARGREQLGEPGRPTGLGAVGSGAARGSTAPPTRGGAATGGYQPWDGGSLGLAEGDAVADGFFADEEEPRAAESTLERKVAADAPAPAPTAAPAERERDAAAAAAGSDLDLDAIADLEAPADEAGWGDADFDDVDASEDDGAERQRDEYEAVEEAEVTSVRAGRASSGDGRRGDRGRRGAARDERMRGGGGAAAKKTVETDRDAADAFASAAPAEPETRADDASPPPPADAGDAVGQAVTEAVTGASAPYTAGRADWQLSTARGDTLEQLAELCRTTADVQCGWIAPNGGPAELAPGAYQSLELRIARRAYRALADGVRGLGSLDVRVEQLDGLGGDDQVVISLTVQRAP